MPDERTVAKLQLDTAVEALRAKGYRVLSRFPVKRETPPGSKSGTVIAFTLWTDGFNMVAVQEYVDGGFDLFVNPVPNELGLDATLAAIPGIPDPAGEKITITIAPAVIFDDAEAWLRENVPDMAVDGIASIWPVGQMKADGSRVYAHEEEEGEAVEKLCTFQDHIDALRLLVELIGAGKLFVGGMNRDPIQLRELSNWDVEVCDVYFQLVYLKEVIYG